MPDGERPDEWYQITDVDTPTSRGPYVAGDVPPVDDGAPLAGADDGSDIPVGLDDLLVEGDDL